MIIKLVIFELEGEYHCIIAFKEIPERVSNRNIVYKDEAEGNSSMEKRKVTEELKEKAKKWAHEQGIKMVQNLYFKPYN